MAWGNIVLVVHEPGWSTSPGVASCASATRSTARGSRPGAVRVVAAAGCAKATPLPVQPAAAALWTLLPSTTAPLHCFY